MKSFPLKPAIFICLSIGNLSVVLGTKQLFQDNNPLLKHLAAEVVDINDPAQAKQHRVTKHQMMTDESAPTPENIALCTSQSMTLYAQLDY